VRPNFSYMTHLPNSLLDLLSKDFRKSRF